MIITANDSLIFTIIIFKHQSIRISIYRFELNDLLYYASKCFKKDVFKL